MRLNHIDSGVPIIIYVGENDEIRLHGKFIDNTSDVEFLIHNPEIYAEINEYIGKSINVSVFIRDEPYRAECVVLGKGGRRKNADTIVLESMSGFKEETRRLATRYDIQTKVMIYEFNDSGDSSRRGSFISEAISADIGKGGLRLFLSRQLDSKADTLYVLEFSTNPVSMFSTYSIPSRIVRWRKNTSVFSTGYDYGFQFDFTKMQEGQKTQEKLFNDLFNITVAGSMR